MNQEKTPVSCEFCYKHKKLYVWDSIGVFYICNECIKKEIKFMRLSN